MRFKKPGRAAALLLVLGLLAAPAPVEAAPKRAAEPAGTSSFFLTLSDWVASLLSGPGSPTAPAPTPTWEASGTGAATKPGPDRAAHAADDPTAEPQLGGDIDPDG